LKAHPYRAFKTLLRREHWRASLPNFHLAMQIVLLTLFFVPLNLRPQYSALLRHSHSPAARALQDAQRTGAPFPVSVAHAENHRRDDF